MPTLSQKEIALRSSVAGVLYAISTVDPTSDSDRNLRYIIGSRWLNIATQEEFVCLDNEPIAAIWKSTTASGSGSAAHIDTVAPTAIDDSGDGYIVGQGWINTTDNSFYIATDVSVGAAVWELVSGGGAEAPHTATADPTVNDDTVDGYVIGQLWVNTASDEAWIATDVTTGAAVWVNITSGFGTITADDVTADADPILDGTTVQAQLTAISSILRGALIVHSITWAVGMSAFVRISPRLIDGYNTAAL